MKNILFPTLLFGAALFTSCSNDFEVSAPWKDIPVVYGLLNIQDTAHYIRVEKAFLDPSANALDIAQNPDSLYYDNALVQLEKVNTGEVFTLQKVDGNLEGYPRQSGVFANAPNWLYKIDSLTLDLHVGDSILLRIDRGNGLPEVTAGTSIIEPGQQRKPGGNEPKFSFFYNLPSIIAWSASENARIFDVKLDIRYTEYPKDNPAAFEKKSLEWKWGQGVRFENFATQYELEKQGIEFYQVMQNNIPVNPDMKRIFEGIDITIISGGFALEKYINVALANTGITGSQDIPTYTNLSEGKGVFSTINYLVTKNGILVPETRDSLKNGMFTKDLNF
ncbi:MAG: hypothetical protein EPO28_16670 [Saprospiraceae bacterium]|nr:MAG: hypothetical protein EPO28_16670 [Saprospiraceae bacterium]